MSSLYMTLKLELQKLIAQRDELLAEVERLRAAVLEYNARVVYGKAVDSTYNGEYFSTDTAGNGYSLTKDDAA